MKKCFFNGLLALTLLAACQSGASNKEATTEQPATTGTPEAPPPPEQKGFNATKTYGNLSFEIIQAAGSATVELRPSGLAATNEPLTATLRGRVADVLVEDIDGDNSPEIGVIDVSGPNGQAVIHVFSVLAKKSMVMVNMQELASDDQRLIGYNGEDAYEFMENTLVRRFPLYEGTTKTGKFRQLQYKLKPGEAMKQLVLDRSSAY